MVPLSGTRLSSIFEVFDVNVYIALLGIYGPCTQGQPIWVTSDDITFFRDRISKIRARQSSRISLLYNCISLLFGLGEACEHQVGRHFPPRRCRLPPVEWAT